MYRRPYPPPPEADKVFHSKAFYSTHAKNRRAKALKVQSTTNDDNPKSKEANLKPHQRTRKPTEGIRTINTRRVIGAG
jgi:hypothetical protein